MTKAKRATALIGLTMALAFPAGVAMTGVAGAQTCTYPATCEPTGNVGDTQASQTSAPPAGTAPAAAKAASLPVTGGDIVGLTLIGGAAVAAGTMLARRTRRP
jgi:hypothetical protein